MTYYWYKIYFKNGNRREIYLLDVTKTDIATYITNGDVKEYNNVVINFADINTVKCHELKDETLTKIVDGQEKTMKAANEE